MILEESEHIEFKEVWRDEYIKTLSAFANTKGGVLYVGVRDDGSIAGIDNNKKLLENIPNKVIQLLGITIGVDSEVMEGKLVLVIKVDKSEHPISYGGRFYIRSGSTTQELKGSELQKKILEANHINWDEVLMPDASWDDLDYSAIDDFLDKTQRNNRLPQGIDKKDVKDIFNKLYLAQNDILTRAAVLMFSKKYRLAGHHSFCKIGRFKGDSDTELITDDIVEGPLYWMPERIMEILKGKYISKLFTYDKLWRIETWEYPEVALREAILNALTHRDYTSEGFFTIKVKDNTLQLWNEGELIAPLSIESLLTEHPSKLRNKLIADIFYRAGLIESWGRGTNKILEDARKGGYAEPSFKVTFGGLQVLFVRKNQDKQQVYTDNGGTNGGINGGINEVLSDVLNLIIQNPGIKVATIIEKTGNLGKRTIERYLKQLKESGMIEYRGSLKTGGYYYIRG